MQVVETIADLRAARGVLQGSVGLVTTMGALHAGHLALVEQARRDHDHVIATIFVNPTQFSPDEDLDAYPRDLSGDMEKLRAAGVDLIFTPTPDLMYPSGYQTYVTVEQVTQGLEGGQRPGHFRGVATIVTKLLNLTQPHAAYFGQKDAQQVVVIRRLVADLNIPVAIIVCPTMREADGLAMSSRNAYLSEDERQSATVLYRALQAAGVRYESGERDPDALIRAALDVLAQQLQTMPDYVSVVDARTLLPPDRDDAPLLFSLAAQVGTPRLLDNCLLPLSLNTRDGLTATLGRVDFT
jgi:pantoate--beta-alanine ligase